MLLYVFGILRNLSVLFVCNAAVQPVGTAFIQRTAPISPLRPYERQLNSFPPNLFPLVFSFGSYFVWLI